MKDATIPIQSDARLMTQSLFLKKCAICADLLGIKKTLSLVFCVERVSIHFACNFNLKMSWECISPIGNA